MKNYKIILVLLFITSSLFAQKMWKNDYSYRYHIWHNDMTVEDAKQIVLTKQPKGVYFYDQAVRFLYEFHRDSLSQFLLDNLNTPFSSKDYDKIYTDKYFRGLLGDTTAIAGMDSLTQFTGGTFKLLIIRKLTEVGIFKYYEFIKQGLQTEKGEDKRIWYYALSLYGVDPRYKTEASQILEEGIRSYVVNNNKDEVERRILIGYLSNFDKPSAIRILEEYFHNSTGMKRSVYYVDLGNLDNDGQPERAKYALLHEQDDTFRRDYIPNPTYYYRHGIERDIGFYTVSFIKFLSDLNVERGTDTYIWKKNFISAFRPV